MRHFRSILAAATLLAYVSAAEAETRPRTVESSSDRAETRIVLPPAVGRFPPLYDDLRGRAEAAVRAFLDAAAGREEGGQDDPAPWSFDYVYEPRYLGPVYASFLVNIIAYRGGAHPSLEYEAVNRDLELTQPVTLVDLFVDPRAGAPVLVALAQYIREDLARQKSERTGSAVAPDDPALQAIGPEPEALEAFTFEPAREDGMIAGLGFHFAPGEAGAQAEGPYHVFVPADVFAGELAGYFPGIFGGEPVEVSRLSNYADPGAFVFVRAPRPAEPLSWPVEVAGEVPAAWLEGQGTTVRIEDAKGRLLGEGRAVEADGETTHISAGLHGFRATVERGETAGSETPAGEGATDGAPAGDAPRVGTLAVVPEGDDTRQVTMPVRF